MDGRTYGHTLTSQPKFLGLIGYQICLAMVLRYKAVSQSVSLSCQIFTSTISDFTSNPSLLFHIFLITGQETNAAMLSFLLAEVGKHPEVEKRLDFFPTAILL